MLRLSVIAAFVWLVLVLGFGLRVAPAAAVENTFETGPGGTIVTVRLTERLSSQDVTIGQKFGFETTAPVTLDDVRVPAKTPGTGVVVFARSGRGPEPGKLRLAAISLRLENGKTIAVGLEDREAGTVSAVDAAHPAGLALPSAVGTIVVGGITRGNNVVYEKGRASRYCRRPRQPPRRNPSRRSGIYAGMSAVIPSPVAFDLDVAEGARLRDAYIVARVGRLPMVLVAFAACFQSVTPLLRLYRYRGNDPIDWALLAAVVVMFALTLTALAFPKRWQRLLVRRQVGMVVTFDGLGITVASGAPRAARKKRIPFAKIRSVSRTPEALLIFGRLQPVLIIPLRALADDGVQIMSFFEERLVATRMLRRSSSRTTIVNTVSP